MVLKKRLFKCVHIWMLINVLYFKVENNSLELTRIFKESYLRELSHLTLTTYSTDNTPVTIHSTDNTLNWQHTPLTTHSTNKTLYRQHALLLTALSPELANSICTLATICNLLSLMYIATQEQPASYLFITRTSHLNHTRPQNAPHTTQKFRVLLLNARTQPSFDQTDDGIDAETSLSLSLHLYLSSPPLHFFLTLTFGL